MLSRDVNKQRTELKKTINASSFTTCHPSVAARKSRTMRDNKCFPKNGFTEKVTELTSCCESPQ
jgi:hypothetical protein